MCCPRGQGVREATMAHRVLGVSQGSQPSPRVLTLRWLQAGRAAGQRAALLSSQAVLVLQAGEGAGGSEPLGGCCRAGTGLLCSAEGPRGEAALQCPRAAPGNLPLPDPSASPWLRPFLRPIPSTYPRRLLAQGMAQGEGCQLPRDRGGVSGCSAVPYLLPGGRSGAGTPSNSI